MLAIVTPGDLTCLSFRFQISYDIGQMHRHSQDFQKMDLKFQKTPLLETFMVCLGYHQKAVCKFSASGRGCKGFSKRHFFFPIVLLQKTIENIGKYSFFAVFNLNGAFNCFLNPNDRLSRTKITFVETLGHFSNLTPTPGGPWGV